MNSQDVTFGVAGQSVYLDVPEGRPASVTNAQVRRWDMSDTETALSATTGSPSIDSVNTTCGQTSGKSQPDPFVLYLASTSDIALWQTYLATDADGRNEWILVAGIDTGIGIRSAVPLALDYVDGNGFVGTRIQIDLDDDWVAQQSNLAPGTQPFDEYRVRWEYDVGGVSYVRTTTFNLVRESGHHNVKPIDLDLRYPGILQVFPQDYRDHRAQKLIDRAHRAFKDDLLALSIPDEQVRSPEIVDEMTVLKSAVHVGQALVIQGGDTSTLEIAQAEYDRRWNQLFRVPTHSPVPIGKDSTGAGHRRGGTPLSLR